MLREAIKDWQTTIDNPNAKVSTIRTLPQNNSLYKWERMLADELNAGGLPFGQIVIKWPRYFTQENIHELIVKPVMIALYPEKKSTSELSTTQIQDVYKHASQIIAERSEGVHVEWPTRFGDGG